MRSIEAIVAIALCTAIVWPVCIAADFNSVTWSTGDGITVTEYTIIGGKLTTSEKWLKASDGTVLYEGNYRNGGQVQWSVLPPKKPTSMFDNTPQVFQQSISFSGFPNNYGPTTTWGSSTTSGSGGSSLEAYNNFISKPIGRDSSSSSNSFTDKFNAFGAKYGGSSFKPLSFS
jgi:hypothetical protein